jgi:hypothetical protein
VDGLVSDPTDTRSGLTRDELPQLFLAADASSLAAQTKFLVLTRYQLVALAGAAICGALTWSGGRQNWVAFGGAAFFLVAAWIRLELLRSRPERTWYDGRALAESTKTLAWRYAVGGNPFPITEALPEVTVRYVEKLKALPIGLKGLSVTPSSQERQITDAMRSLRESPLAERQSAYEHGRVADQARWYAQKSEDNATRAQRWNNILLLVELLGVLGAVLKAMDVVRLDLLGFSAAIVAGGTAWLQTKQHENLASAYALASSELATIRELIAPIGSEEEWARFVDEAEEAISREHTMWKASRS